METEELNVEEIKMEDAAPEGNETEEIGKEKQSGDAPTEAGAESPAVTAPFLHGKDTTATIMRDVAFALLPAAAFGVYRFGFRAFLIMLLSVTSCVLTEHVCKRIRKMQNGGYECSAIVTGLLLGMMLPLNVPYWFPVAGGVFAIGIVKMLFGGLGRNRLNPAATAKCLFLVLAGPVMQISVKGYLVTWKETELSDLFFGYGVGMVGEVSAFLILLGGLYLVSCKVITLYTPVMYLLSFSAVLLLSGGQGFDLKWLAMQLCVGGVMLGAFFLANDYTTAPMTRAGKMIYGVVLGVLTGLLRVMDFTVEAVAVAVICGNVFVPVINMLTLPKHSGKERKANR